MGSSVFSMIATRAGGIEHTEAHQYVCLQVEADTRMVYHLSVLSKARTLFIRSIETDAIITLVYHTQKIQANIWMNLGHSRDNTIRYVYISELAYHLGPVLCMALPGYHALTGCDYSSLFFSKGKEVSIEQC